MSAVPENILVTEILKQGWITLEQLEECREIQKKVKEMGLSEPLVDILVKRNYLTKEQVTSLVEPEKAGKVVIPGYRVVAKIGTGGMGVVYKGVQLSVDRTVAIKVLPLRSGQEKEQAERFIREARNLAQLNHVNIVAAIDAGQVGRVMYYVMEFVDGESAGQMIRKQGKIPESQALKIVIQTARALDHAQKHNLVHRDIKPDNILITKEGVAKLADLGLAKSTTEDVSLTQTGIAIGTPNYISPEQARGERTLDIRSDIYSLGAALYHMVVGEAPFKGTSALEVITKHLTEQLPSPKQLNPQLSDGICIIIEKMLAKDKNERYQDPASLIRDLDLVMAGKMPQAERLEVGRSAVMHKVRVAEPAAKAGAAPGRATSHVEPSRRTATVSPRPTAAMPGRPVTVRSAPSPRKKTWLLPVGIAAALLVAAGIYALVSTQKEPPVVATNPPPHPPEKKPKPPEKPKPPDPPKLPEVKANPDAEMLFTKTLLDVRDLIEQKNYRQATQLLDDLRGNPTYKNIEDLGAQIESEKGKVRNAASRDVDAIKSRAESPLFELAQSVYNIFEFKKPAEELLSNARRYADTLQKELPVLEASIKNQIPEYASELTELSEEVQRVIRAAEYIRTEYSFIKDTVFGERSPVRLRMAAWNYKGAADVLRQAKAQLKTPLKQVLEDLIKDFEDVHQDLFVRVFNVHAEDLRSEGVAVTGLDSKRVILNHQDGPTLFWNNIHAKYRDLYSRDIPIRGELIKFLIFDGSPSLAKSLIDEWYGGQPERWQNWSERYVRLTQVIPFVLMSGGNHKLDHVRPAGIKVTVDTQRIKNWDVWNRYYQLKYREMVDSEARSEFQAKKILGELGQRPQVYDSLTKEKPGPLTEEMLNKEFQVIVQKQPVAPTEVLTNKFKGKEVSLARDQVLRDVLNEALDEWRAGGHKVEREGSVLKLIHQGDKGKTSPVLFGRADWQDYEFSMGLHWWGETLGVALRLDEEGRGVFLAFRKEYYDPHEQKDRKPKDGEKNKGVVLRVAQVKSKDEIIPLGEIDLGEANRDRAVTLKFVVRESTVKISIKGGKAPYENSVPVPSKSGKLLFVYPGELKIHEMSFKLLK